MLMKYKILFKSGIQEEFTQEGELEELSAVHKTVYESLVDDAAAVVTFGDGEKVGRFIRVSDISQFEMEVVEEFESNIIESNGGAK